MTVDAMEAATCQLIAATRNADGLTVDQGISQFTARRYENSLKCGAGYVHPLGTLLLFQAVHVLETYRLSFLNGQSKLLQHV